jgi:hypothetical protein
MSKLNKSYLEKANFKNKLWSKVSNEACGDAWCYSASEKRVFFTLTILCFMLLGVYLTGTSKNMRDALGGVDSMDKVNKSKIDKIKESLPEATPSIGYVVSQ